MLKKDPKPNMQAGAPPEADPYILTFWKNRIDLSADNQLKHLQTALLYTAGPLAGLWSQIVEHRPTQGSRSPHTGAYCPGSTATSTSFSRQCKQSLL